MIYYPEFTQQIQSRIGVSDHLWHSLLHFLFPAEIPGPEGLEPILGGVSTYQKCALLGFLLFDQPESTELQNRFRREMDIIKSKSLDESMLIYDKPALMGMALGLSMVPDREHNQWFRDTLLVELPAQARSVGLNDFFRAVAEPSYDAIGSIPQPEYRYFLATWKGDKLPGRFEAQLREWYVQSRKKPIAILDETPMEGANDLDFDSLLSVYVMDRCLQFSLWEPEAVKIQIGQALEKTLEPIRKYVVRRVHRSSRLLAFLSMAILGAVVVYLTGYFFQEIGKTDSGQEAWDNFEAAFYTVGGPVAALVLAIRLITNLFNHKNVAFDFWKLSEWIAGPRIRRKLKAMGIRPSAE